MALVGTLDPSVRFTATTMIQLHRSYAPEFRMSAHPSSVRFTATTSHLRAPLRYPRRLPCGLCGSCGGGMYAPSHFSMTTRSHRCEACGSYGFSCTPMWSSPTSPRSHRYEASSFRSLLRPTVGAPWVTSHHALCFSPRVSQSISCVLVSSLCAIVEFSKRGPTYPEYHRHVRHIHAGVPRGVWISVMTHLCDTARALSGGTRALSGGTRTFGVPGLALSVLCRAFLFLKFRTQHRVFSILFGFACGFVESSYFGIRFCFHCFYFLFGFFFCFFGRFFCFFGRFFCFFFSFSHCLFLSFSFCLFAFLSSEIQKHTDDTTK
jgi:hypothetical protein